MLQLPDEKIAVGIQIFSWKSRDGLVQTQATLPVHWAFHLWEAQKVTSKEI